MTKREESTEEFDAYIAAAKAEEKLNEAIKASQDLRSGKGEKGVNELKKVLYDYLKSIDAPRPAEAKDLTDQHISSYVPEQQKHLHADVGRQLTKDITSVLNQAPENGLESLLFVPEVREKVDPKVGDAVEKYVQFRALKQLADDAEKGKTTPEQRGLLVNAAVKGIYDETLKNERYKGLNPEALKSIAQIRATAMKIDGKDKDINKYAVPGLKAQTAEAEKAYKATEVKMADVARAAYKSLIESDSKAAEEAQSLLYAAHSGKIKTPKLAAKE